VSKVEKRSRKILPELNFERCSECGKVGPHPMRLNALFDPPQWVIENEWLLYYAPLCRCCLEKGARIELCYEKGEGGTHNYYQPPGSPYPICLDCGESELAQPTESQMVVLREVRRTIAVESRRAELEFLKLCLPLLSGPPLRAMEARLSRLTDDLNWLQVREAESQRAAAEELVAEFEAAGVDLSVEPEEKKN
jgi:hypothetical protein